MTFPSHVGTRRVASETIDEHSIADATDGRDTSRPYNGLGQEARYIHTYCEQMWLSIGFPKEIQFMGLVKVSKRRKSIDGGATPW